jgi:hypothetical protein
MSEKETQLVRCSHCSNRAPMEVVAKYSQVQAYEDPNGPSCEEGDVYQLLLCPSCSGVTLQKYYWHDGYMDPSDVEYKILYPSDSKKPLGLPETIDKAYESALRVRPIDANAFGVLLGRVLDLICIDRKAEGRTLSERLDDLASKGEIPGKLVQIAKGLRQFRNVGAHAELGELTTAEVPILEDLTRAILEYVYSAPLLVSQAEQHLQRLKSKE